MTEQNQQPEWDCIIFKCDHMLAYRARSGAIFAKIIPPHQSETHEMFYLGEKIGDYTNIEEAKQYAEQLYLERNKCQI